jgi:thiol-disulfide isomerase/thioredoxin
MDKVSVIEWTSDTCTACRSMKGMIDTVNAQYHDHLGYYPIEERNIKDYPEEVIKERIMSLPTFVVKAGDKQRTRYSGTVTIKQLREWIDDAMTCGDE